MLRSCGEPFLLAFEESGEIAEGSPFLIGKIGSPKTVARSIPSVILGKVREHSRKPQAAFNACEAMIPGARRLDLFSRTKRTGWDVAGDEADTFDEVGS